MSQASYSLANQLAASFRAALNSVLAAILTANSGATEPSPASAYMRWADTANGIMKMRNSTNTAWINLFYLADGRPCGTTSYMATVLDDANASTARSTLGLGSIVTRNLTVSTDDPPEGFGSDGDVWFKREA